MLPFPRAHFYVGAFLIITFAAFTPSYFAVLPDASFAHHLHGITATLWIVLLMTQNWSIHKGLWPLHAWSGRASIALVPLFTAGGLLVTQVTLLKETPFKEMFGTRLAVADFVATFAFIAFYYGALKHRRTPDIHARYMLATVFLLIGPSLARLFANYVPGFLVRSLETLPNFGKALDASMIVAVVFCLVLIGRDAANRKPVAPFSWALVATILMFGGYKWFGGTAFWVGVSEAFAVLPSSLIMAAGIVISIAATYAAWFHPAEPATQRAAVAAAVK